MSDIEHQLQERLKSEQAVSKRGHQVEDSLVRSGSDLQYPHLLCSYPESHVSVRFESK